MERLRFGIVAAHVAAQLLAGVISFWFAPQAVFVDLPADPLAGVTLRLAVYSNLAMVVLIVWLLCNRRDPSTVRVIALAGVVYNTLAGIDGIAALIGAVPVRLAEPVSGPAIFHSAAVVLLLAAAAWPCTSHGRSSSVTADQGGSWSDRDEQPGTHWDTGQGEIVGAWVPSFVPEHRPYGCCHTGATLLARQASSAVKGSPRRDGGRPSSSTQCGEWGGCAW
jgi:hypothetical protein